MHLTFWLLQTIGGHLQNPDRPCSKIDNGMLLQGNSLTKKNRDCIPFGLYIFKMLTTLKKMGKELEVSIQQFQINFMALQKERLAYVAIHRCSKRNPKFSHQQTLIGADRHTLNKCPPGSDRSIPKRCKGFSADSKSFS